MSRTLHERLHAAFAPPRYLGPAFSGIDVSTSGVKAVHLSERASGLVITNIAEARFPSGAFADGEIVDHAVAAKIIAHVANAAHIRSAHVALPESKSYLFETIAPGADTLERRTAVEQHLDELVPLPPAETIFDIVKVGHNDEGDARVVGVGLARRIIDDTLSTFDQAGVEVQSLEGEMFSSARALLPPDDDSTALIIDIGRTVTKIGIIAERIPRFATTINIGGGALTHAVQKYFGVTEHEARRVKDERGIVPMKGNEEYLAAMLSTVSALRDEIMRRLEYWLERVASSSSAEPVSHAILVGGNASTRGLPEYFEAAFGVPVVIGNVFTNLAPPGTGGVKLDTSEAVTYATAIGLALRDTIPPYA